MTILSSSAYDPQMFSAMLKRLAVRINADAATSLLESDHYDTQFIPTMLKRIVDAINENYDGEIISSQHYDDQFIAEVLQRCVDKVNAGAAVLPDPLVFLDFANEYYYAGGQERAAADIFADPGAHVILGSTPGLPYISANGWEVGIDAPLSQNQAIQPSGAWQTDLTTEVGRSIVVDLTVVGAPSNSLIWTVFSGNELDGNYNQSALALGDFNGPGSIYLGTGLSVGQHKIGFTVAPGTYSLWVDGVLIGTEILGEPMSLSDGEHGIRIGGTNMFVASITAYVPLTGDQMITLTTVPGDEFVLQLDGENLQLDGEDLTLGA